MVWNDYIGNSLKVKRKIHKIRNALDRSGADAGATITAHILRARKALPY